MLRVVDFVGELAGVREEIERVDDEKQVVVRLEMDGPGVFRRGDVGHVAGILRVACVYDRESLRPRMGDIGIAAMDHDLKAVAAAANVGMADEAHVAGKIRLRQVAAHSSVLKQRERRRAGSAPVLQVRSQLVSGIQSAVAASLLRNAGNFS